MCNIMDDNNDNITFTEMLEGKTIRNNKNISR